MADQSIAEVLDELEDRLKYASTAQSAAWDLTLEDGLACDSDVNELQSSTQRMFLILRSLSRDLNEAQRLVELMRVQRAVELTAKEAQHG